MEVNPTPSRLIPSIQVLKRVGFPGAMVAEPIVVICGLIINCFQPGEIRLIALRIRYNLPPAAIVVP